MFFIVTSFPFFLYYLLLLIIFIVFIIIVIVIIIVMFIIITIIIIIIIIIIIFEKRHSGQACLLLLFLPCLCQQQRDCLRQSLTYKMSHHSSETKIYGCIRIESSNFKPKNFFIFTKQHHISLSMDKVVNKSFFILYTVCAKLLQQRSIIHVTDGKIQKPLRYQPFWYLLDLVLV